jgi:hypothetical protein
MTATTLPAGTYVRVDDPGCWDTAQRRMVLAPKTYFAIIVGTDLFGSKYEVGHRYGGWDRWLFSDGGSWAAPQWCTVVTYEEATAPVGDEP